MRTLTALLVAGLVLGSSGMAMAATTANAGGTATATIIAPITITNSADLAFGNIVADQSTTGTVLLSASATPTRTPTTVVLPATTGTVTAAKFRIGGATGFAYTVTLPGSAATLTRTSGSETMTVDTFTDSLTAHGGTISATATDNDFYVGGTLHVGSAQVAGTYTGSFNVVVAYN